MNIGERIAFLRENKGMKQKELAEKADINTSVMNRIEKGTRPLTDNEIVKISKILEVSTDYLLGRAPEINVPTKTFDSLSEINKLVKEFGIEDFGFFDIEQWKKLRPEDIDELRRHFEWVTQKAKEREQDKQ
ncbi:helix-turn-helix domain-containing protein [Niallia sp. BSM11]|uniref:helix-turn-helix domain-containing protein n=1 Tax=Niallia sp. BSM11 TaxID=3391576 RepID=UPI00398505A5